MNGIEDQGDGNQWAADESDIDYDSDASLSDSDGSEGEVPMVTGHVKEPDPSSNSILGAVRAQPKLPVWTAKSSTIATPNLKESAFSRGWKPVIDGKIQVSGELPALNTVRPSSLQATSTATSSRKHSSSENASASPAATGLSEPKKDGNESDSDVRRVPEMSTKGGASGASSAQPQGQPSTTRSRKRGGAPADKEHKRLKRLLRNRVSAQQARERKKAYLSDLEVRSKELQQRNEELEERVSTLQRENYMLRQIVKTTAIKKNGVGGSTGMEP